MICIPKPDRRVRETDEWVPSQQYVHAKAVEIQPLDAGKAQAPCRHGKAVPEHHRHVVPDAILSVALDGR